MTSAVPLRRVVAIGPESTGKTILATRLADALAVPLSLEYARLFVDEHPRPVVVDDVEAIVRGQMAVEDAAIAEARRAGAPLVVHDTDLVSSMVYSWHYFGTCPQWVESAARARLADLYLLHDIDVPWEEEAFTRVEPERRAELFERFRATLAACDARVVRISGDWNTRFETARHSVDTLPAAR